MAAADVEAAPVDFDGVVASKIDAAAADSTAQVLGRSLHVVLGLLPWRMI